MPRDAMAEWLAKRNAEKAAQRATPEHGAVRQAQIKVDQILEQAKKTTTALTGVKTGKTEKSSTPVRQEEGRDAMAEWLAARKESKVQQIAEQGKYAVRNVGALYKAATGMWGELRKANEWQGLGVDAGIRQGYQARVPVRGGSQLQQQAENALQMDKTGPYRQRLTRVRGESLEKLFTDSLNQNQTAEQHGQTIRQELQELRTAGESGTDAAAAKEKWDDVASRLYYLAYSQSMSSDEYNKLVSEVYDAYDAYRSGVKGRSFGQREQKWTDALRGPVMGDENYTAAGKAQQNAMLAAAGGIPTDRNTFGYELRYNQSTTRENIQYKSVDQLLDAAGKHVDPQADVTSQSQGAATDAAIFGYLANVAMTQEQYDRYMQALDRYVKNAPATRAVSGYGTSDVVSQLETYRQQREANGLRANEKGAEDALNSYPEMSAGSFLDQVASGSERARDNLFQKYPAGLEQLLVRGGGYAGKALGSLLNGFGAFENDLGDYFAAGGEENINYQNPEWQEAKYQDWVRGRETSDLLQNGGKFERWAAEQIPALPTAALEMAAASTIAGAATGTMESFAGGARQVSPLVTSAATKAEKFAQMAKQGSNIVTSSFAAINSYGEAESNGDARGEQFIRFAAGGLLEYGTNMLFGGNPLIDAGDTGKVTELVYKMTNNETIRKIVSSAAFDRIGEGLEEVASAIGSAALDYALTGEADLSWDELRDEFISGFALAMILSIGPDTAEVLAKNDHEGNAKRITMFDAAAQSDRGELNLQMGKYAVEFLAGDEDMMLANGWDHVQRSAAKKSWAQAVNEYNTVYRNLVDAEAYWAKTGEGKAYRGTDAERVIADARGSIEGVDAKTFSAETLEENVRQIRQAWDSAEENATNFAMTGRMDAEIAKMARIAESYLDKAVQDGTMDAMTALNLRNELSMINEGATATLQAYLNARYGEGTPQTETRQEPVQEATQDVNVIRAEAENNAAVNAAETGGIDNGRTEIFDGGSQRDAGLGTGEQTGGMAAGAAAAEGERRNAYAGAGENGPANRRANLRPEDAARAERLNRYASLQSDTSLAQLVRGGSDAVTLAVIPESMYDDGMREAKQAGTALGVDVVFVRGSMAMQRGDQLMRINGVYDAAAKRAVVSATDIQYDGGKLAQHELFHVRANKDPALVQQALQKVRETFGEEAFEQVAREYVQSYSGAYQSMEDVYEEVLADAYAGMNRFRAGATHFTEAVQSEVQQSERASEPAQTSQETRGSPPANVEERSGNPEKGKTFWEKMRAWKEGGAPDAAMEPSRTLQQAGINELISLSSMLEKADGKSQTMREAIYDNLKYLQDDLIRPMAVGKKGDTLYCVVPARTSMDMPRVVEMRKTNAGYEVEKVSSLSNAAIIKTLEGSDLLSANVQALDHAIQDFGYQTKANAQLWVRPEKAKNGVPFADIFEARDARDFEAKFSLEEKQYARVINEQLLENRDRILEIEPVYELTGGEFAQGDKKLSDAVMEEFEKFGGEVEREGFGAIKFSKKRIKNDIMHGIGRMKAMTFAAVPSVIQNGVEIGSEANWKGRGYDTYVFAAPAKFGETNLLIGAVVTRDNRENKFYLHEVVDSEGNAIKIDRETGEIKTSSAVADGWASTPDALSKDRIAQTEGEVKQRFSLSEPVERAGNLIAEHNLTQEKLEKALEIGAFPSPSIAIVQAEQGHTNYGDYSVVFPASTIDPEADSRNRVYGADAWTPTSSNATVEYRVDADAKRAFERSIRDLSGQVADGIFRGDSTLGKAGIEEETTKTSREIAEQIAQYPEVKAAYLADKGENISPVYKDREYDNIGNAALQRYTDNVGVQNLARIIVQMYVGDANSVAQAELQRVRQAIGEEYAERFARILDRKPERKAERVSEYAENKMYSGTRAEDFIRHAWEMVQDGGQNRGEADKMAMQDELDRKAPTQKVAAWAEKRLQDVIGEGGIYNNEDRYTSRGDRRSFEQTHWELNAENLVRAMAQAEERGANIMWYDAGGLLAAATPEYRSISEIHADEGRLQTLEQEAYEGKVMELQQSLDNVVERILQETRHKAYGYQDESQLITEALIKTAQGGDSLQSIREGMAAEEYDIDRATAMQIQELFQQAKEIPTSYFEAKPQRVVGFDEAVALLAPASAPADLMARAEDAGLRVIRYTGQKDRIRVANELPGVKFSVQEELQDIRENGIRGKELASEREETQPEDVLGYADDMGEPVLSESYFRDWVQQQTNAMPQGFVWGKDVPFYSQTTDLSPKQAVELLEAVTGKRWRVEPRKNGGWRAVETDFAAKQGMYTPQEAANRLNAAKKARADADAAAYRNGEAPARATTVAAEGVAKDSFRATPALDKIGVKIDMGVTDYRTTKEMRQRAEAEYQTDKLISKAERRWGATALEKNFARDIAAGRYSYADIPDTARWDTVTDLANLYIDKRMLGEDLRLQRKYAIRDALLYKAMELLPDELELMSDPGGFDKEALLVLNYRTPQRSMLKMFGDKRGEEINRYYFDPVTRNEAERLRWMNRQLDAVREFQGEGDKVKGLNKAESAYVHMALDIEATVQRINQSPNKAAIQKAVTELTKMETAQKASPDAEAREAEIQRVATELDLNAAESKWAQQYAQFLTQKDGIKGEIDEKKCAAAVKQYRQLFDDYYNAIADFLVSHGDEPIGKIDYYAPHLSTADKVNLLNQAFEALGFNASATRLPAEIAGRTEDFRPNKRWTPFFQSREGTQTEYDIVHGFESYVTYLSDVLFHTDDIQKIRALENYTRLGGKNDFKNSLAEAIELSRSGQRDEKLDFLRELKRVDDFAEPTTAEINKQLDQYIAELFAAEKNNTRYSDLAVWLKNYGDVLAGKQFGGDRGAEHRGGRGILKLGTQLTQAFARANVAGNVSSAVNQIAQLPTILGERSKRSIAQATAEFATGKLRQFQMDSDFITGKKGVDYISNTFADSFMSGMFKPAEFVDTMMSTIAARAAYLDAIRDGKTHEEAMRAADAYARSIMGDRTKGAKPLMFHSKTPVMQMVNMFQIEALNSWEHVSQDLPRQFRQIAAESGKAKAARVLSSVILKTVLAAFVVNRVTEELYGGTPAPFDIIGMCMNFIASGEGLTTNDWIRYMLNKASNAMFGVDLFDDVPTPQEGFDWGNAVEDTLYNISNEVPFLSNLSGMVGVGDRTLMMPDLFGKGKDLWDAATEHGLISPESGEALLGLVTQAIPGGRQINKTYSGIKTIVEGGRTKGFGDKERLQYPVERNVGTALQNILFGPNATPQANAYWASGLSSLSTKDTQTWQTLSKDGADPIETYNLLHEFIKINADDTLTTDQAQRDIRDAINNSSLTDEQKAYLFRQEFGRRNKETGEYEHATDAMFETLMDEGVSWDGVTQFYNKLMQADGDENLSTNDKNRQKRTAIRELDVRDSVKAYTYAEVFGVTDKETGAKSTSKDEVFANMMDAGMSWDDVMDVYEEYRTLYEDESLSSSQQASEFAYWLDQHNIKGKKREAIRNGLKYYQMFAQEAERYTNLTEAGLSATDAKKVSDKLASAKGTGENGQLTTNDKVDVLLKQNLTDTSLYKALSTVLSEETYDKLTEARSGGIGAKIWMQYWKKKAELSADKDANGKSISGSKKAKILALINSLQLTAEQKDLLYRAEGYAERDLYKAPWH